MSERYIDSTQRTIYKSCPVGAQDQRSYLATIRIRVNTWTNLTTHLNKNHFSDIFYNTNLNDTEKERIWHILAHCNYHLFGICDKFFDFLGEVAIEEKVSLKSYSSAEALRKWPNAPIPSRLQDNYLLFLYMAIRDGSRALTLINNL